MAKSSRRPRRLVLEAVQTLRTIEATTAAVRDLLAQHPHVEIVCGAVGEADLTLVQLLLSARRTAEQSGKRVTLAAPASGALLDALRRGGLAEAADPFWLHSGEAT